MSHRIALVALTLAACSNERPPVLSSGLDAGLGADAARTVDARSDATADDARSDVLTDGRAVDGPLAVDAPDAPDAPPPPSFGPGFTDLTADIETSPPFRLEAPSATTGGDPEYTAGVFTDTGVHLQRRTTSMEPIETVLYRYDPATGALTRGASLTSRRDGRALGAGMVLDLDGDGRMDLVAMRPRFELAWGTADGGFEATEPLDGVVVAPGTYAPPWGSMNVDDLDDDGWLDVMVGTSTCCSTCREMKLFLRTGPRTFADRTDLLGEAEATTGVALMSVPLWGARTLVVVGNQCGGEAPGFYRRGETDAQGYPRFDPGDPTPDDAYVRLHDDPGPRHTITRWAPMAAALADLDRDGRDDLGLSLNFYVSRFQNVGPMRLVDRTDADGPPELRSAIGRPMIPWGLAFVDFDQDGRDDEVVTHGNDHSSMVDPAAFIGPMRTRALWNAGAFRWVDVSAALHLDRMGQWRSLTVGDLEGDGDADLIVGGAGDLPRVFRNDIRSGNHGFSLRLRGTTSNALGVGAVVEVTVRAGDVTQRYVAGGMASPFVTSEPLVFVGLGAAERAARVRITWPSGTVQELSDVAAGTRHTVTEPVTLTVDPPTRHLTVASRAAATLRITPRAADGSLRPGATVTAAVTAGAARIPEAPTWDGSAFVVRVQPPATAGSSVVTVRIDGAPLGVRPRLWWD